ncbi:MAG: WecB/TagA/CpsF family glycosyltransferase [bacterium]|nr:WecB/TagA/CpsF family glycosyltransferase [bacterium]
MIKRRPLDHCMSYMMFGLRIDDVNREEAVRHIERFFKEDRFHYIVTLNPEGVVIAQDNKIFSSVVNGADLVVADGSWLVRAVRFLGGAIKERVAGIDLLLDILSLCKEKGYSVYLLGAKEDTIVSAKKRLEDIFPGIRILGFHNGYFDIEEEAKIVEEINSLKPDFLVVGLGMPKQEIWINRHRDLSVRLAIGVGGSFDVISGNIPRAPYWMQVIGLEWFYRVLKDPKRVKRLSFIPRFFLLVLKSKLGVV